MAERRPAALAAIALAALLASCARHEPPAPVVTGAPPPPVVAPPAPASVTVRRGDSLYLIAKREKVTVRGLIDANRLRAPYTLRPGQVLLLPPTRSTLPPPAPQAPVAPPAVEPGPAATGASPALPAGPVASAPAPPLAAPSAPPAATTPEPTPAIAAPGPPAADPAPPPRSGRGFTWPVRGNVISNFGAKAGGLQNDGINIAAARGTPVRAADSGVVVYAGNELKGFGNLLLLRHADGWMTAYAHLDDIAVERGQNVQRGQVVARVGQSGSVTSPQLHFEVRRGTRPVDPRDHLQPVISASLR